MLNTQFMQRIVDKHCPNICPKWREIRKKESGVGINAEGIHTDKESSWIPE